MNRQKTQQFPELKKASTLEEAIRRLDTLMRRLRKECPWDRKQTPQTIRHLTIEEVYELSNAILKQNTEDFREELGDLLLHVFFYSLMAEENKQFTLIDVINALCDKLIARHPHIYSNFNVDSADQVKRNWELIKRQNSTRKTTSVFSTLPPDMPSLIKAYRIQEKASHYGFDWKSIEGVWEKVKEELKELEEATRQNNKQAIESEIGDLLFAIVNLARFLKVNPDDALEKACLKFIKRFNAIEEYARKKGIPLENLDLEEMDEIWEESKKKANTSM